MNNENLQTPFSKAILTGLFVGIVSTLCCFIYGITYRSYTGFSLSAIINVSSIIFVCNLLLMTCGLIYLAFKNMSRYGGIFFSILFAALTIFCLWKTAGIERSNIYQQTVQFRGLLSGIIVIVGLMASFAIPILFNNKSFEKHVI